MNTEFTRLIEGFREWLHIIGYSDNTVTSQPRVIEKYFLFMEANKIKQLEKINREDTWAWYKSEKQRRTVFRTQRYFT